MSELRVIEDQEVLLARPLDYLYVGQLTERYGGHRPIPQVGARGLIRYYIPGARKDYDIVFEEEKVTLERVNWREIGEGKKFELVEDEGHN